MPQRLEGGGREREGAFFKGKSYMLPPNKNAPFCGTLPLSQTLGYGLTYIISFIFYNSGTQKAPAHFTDEDTKALGA